MMSRLLVWICILSQCMLFASEEPKELNKATKMALAFCKGPFSKEIKTRYIDSICNKECREKTLLKNLFEKESSEKENPNKHCAQAFAHYFLTVPQHLVQSEGLFESISDFIGMFGCSYSQVLEIRSFQQQHKQKIDMAALLKCHKEPENVMPLFKGYQCIEELLKRGFAYESSVSIK